MTPEQLHDLVADKARLWLDEVDNRTHRSNEARQSPAENLEQTHTVHWREWAKNMSHDSGLWFMDLGIGWFDEKGIMDNIAKIVRANKRVRKIPHQSVAQVLYVIDQESKLALPYDLTRAAAEGMATLCSYGKLRPVIVSRDFMLTPAFLREHFGVNPKRILFPDMEQRTTIAQLAPSVDTDAAALITGAQTYKTYRCPHCGKGLPYISPKGENAGDCPYCGELLEFND